MIKRMFSYIAILAFIFIWSFYFRSYELLFLSIFVLILPILDILIVKYSIRKINISHNIKTSIVNKGEYIPIDIRIDNKGLLLVVLLELKFKCNNYYQGINKTIKFALPILKYGKQEYSFSIKSDHCGDMDIELDSVSCSDYFELYNTSKNINKKTKVYILPQIGSVEDIVINKKTIIDLDGEKFSEVKPGDDPSQVFDFREYHSGDKLHSIHWKLSARRGNYMVKEYSLPLNGNYCVIMDLSFKDKKEKWDIIDVITETTLTIILRLQEEGINHYLVGMERYGDVCYKDIIQHDLPLTDTMFELYKSKYIPNGDLLSVLNGMEYENNESQVYFVTANLNKKTLIKLNSMFKDLNVNIIVIGDKREFDENDISLAYTYEFEITFVRVHNAEEDIAKLQL